MSYFLYKVLQNHFMGGHQRKGNQIERESPSRESIFLHFTTDRNHPCEESQLMTGKLENAQLDIQELQRRGGNLTWRVCGEE